MDVLFLVILVLAVGFLVSIHTGYMDSLTEKADSKADQNKHE